MQSQSTARRSPVERFWSRVDKSGDCWLWTGNRSTSGFGLIGVNGSNVLVHRFSWELANGPVPEGRQIARTCRNASCVRPEHLYATTWGEIQRKRERPEQARCSVDGCESPSAARGMCDVHYHLTRRNGAPVYQEFRRGKSEERFWKYVNKDGACWLWTRSRTRDGYGIFCPNGSRNVLAHRYSWEISFGSIPSGMEICHRCDNPSCVRPGHLFLGTHRDNIADMIAKQRQPRGEEKHSAKLTEQDVRQIRALSQSGVANVALASQFGVAWQTIDAILRRRKWTHVE